MKKCACLILVLALLATGLLAQQGEYLRKSVSAVGSVWFGPGVSSYNFNQDFFDLLVKEYIEVSRFDYNQLPASSLTGFRQRANAMGGLDVDALGSLLEQTVGKDVARVLSDPEIQKARVEGFESESARVQLARVKGREYGLTEEQLTVLMNSAYLYLPYVSAIEQKQEGSTVSYDITGGIIWWQVKVSPDGAVSIELVESGSDNGYGSAVIGNTLLYGKFRLGSQTFSTNAQQYAMFSGMQAWVKNLAVIMKRIPDFSLSAQIVEKLSSSRFSSNLGRREGVNLDDLFRVLELYEDSQGQIKKKRIGYARLIKNVDNRKEENRDKLSVVKLHSGSRIMPGSVLEEYPRLGLEIAIAAGPVNGFNLPSDIFASTGVTTDSDSGFGFNLDLSYNLAPIIGITQSFWDIEYAMMFPTVEDNLNETGATLSSIYTGFTKKAWIGRHGLGFSARGGVGLFASKVEINSVEYTTNILALGARLGAKYIFMLSPSFQLTAGISKTFSTGSLSATMDIGNATYDINEAALENLELGDTRISFGFNWLLKSFPINMFGWLDPLKKY